MKIAALKAYKLFQNIHIKEFKPLSNQGNSNLIYLLTTKDQTFIVRKFQISLDRKQEFSIQKKAFLKNIGANPILLDEKNRLMITAYLKGKHQTKLSQQELKKIALLLKRLHKINVPKKRNNFKENFKFKEKKVKKAFILLEKEPKEYALGHNDLHAKNIIFSKNSIKLIDWEYARYSDIYFDLVSIIIEYKLNKKDSKTFLRSYFERRTINHKKIKAFTLIYKERWRLWFEKLKRGEL